MSLKEELSYLEKMVSNSVRFDVANISQIDFTNAMLKNNELSALPTEYQEFLMESDGLILPPYEFYGTKIIERMEYNYKFPSIIEVNMPLVKNKNPLIKNRVIIGSMFFDVIIFDETDKKFKILSRINFETVKTFEKFKQLLEYIKETL